MFYTKYYLDISSIHGIGLFAGEDIGMGEIIWVPSNEFTLNFTEKELELLHSHKVQVIKHYGYLCKRTGVWNYSSEDSRYINHSENPNVELTPCNILKNGIWANKKIKKGEEITQDYSDFEELRSF